MHNIFPPLYIYNYISYKYVCGGKEDVDRKLTGDNTHNELVGRSLTMYDMPEFGYPNAEPWTRSIGRTELFDPKYVPIIIIDSDKQFFTGRNSGVSAFNKITFILQDSVLTFDVNIHIKIQIIYNYSESLYIYILILYFGLLNN